MPRRTPPRDYDEEDDFYEVERERDRRPRRRDRDYEDVEFRRRRSEPLAEDMERMHIRERPRRDFMDESFAPPRARDDVVRTRTKEEVDIVSSDRDDVSTRPSGPRRRPHFRDEDDEDLVFEERETRRGSRRHPREVDKDFIFEERERRPERRHRPGREREVEDDLVIEERERERGGGRRRRSEPIFEEDEEIISERPRRRGSRHRSRESEEDDLIIEDREIRRGSRRHPERMSEDDLLVEEKEVRHHRRRPESGFEEDLSVEERGKHRGRRRRPEREFEEEEVFIRRKEREEPPLDRGWESEIDVRSRERILEFEEEDPYRRRRPRPRPPPPQTVQVEEVILDDAPPKRHRGPVDFSDREIEEDVVIRRKDKGPRPDDSDDEEKIVIRDRRETRRSVPSDPEPELRGLRGLRRNGRRRIPLDGEVEEEISIRKSDIPSRQSPLQVHTPRMKLRSRRGGRMSEEEIILTRSDSEDSLAPEDSISPTSGPSLGFNDPWERETISLHRRPVPLEDDSDIAHSHEIRAPSMREMEKDIVIESTRVVDEGPTNTDGWSVVHASSQDEAIMSGALDVVEVKPRHVPLEEVETGRIAQQVTGADESPNDRWTEIAKRLVVREAIEQLGFEYEETRTCYYIFSYLKPEDIDELVELTDEIRSARRRRIHDIQRERSVPDIRPRLRPRVGMPPRAWLIEKRMRDIRDREWMNSR
ncbi:hypothetical protein DTO013E5_5142 [Penicillium roqueforti]|nr:hypothetical protein DTO012A1_4283 [Penicillium roqueforti]KAI2750265.1 hypothetical protein DTO013F2_4728 [Penicillium roqueforti]KAI3210075.1 hypothetical protein DTO013E5_5142 [Penicillium roqueforti]